MVGVSNSSAQDEGKHARARNIREITRPSICHHGGVNNKHVDLSTSHSPVKMTEILQHVNEKRFKICRVLNIQTVIFVGFHFDCLQSCLK